MGAGRSQEQVFSNWAILTFWAGYFLAGWDCLVLYRTFSKHPWPTPVVTTKNVPRWGKCLSPKGQSHHQLRAAALELKYFPLTRFPFVHPKAYP